MKRNKNLLVGILSAVSVVCAVAAVVLIVIRNVPASEPVTDPSVTEPSVTETLTDTRYYDTYGIKLLSSDNESVPFDINAYFDENGTAWLFLPAEADPSSLNIRIYDENGGDVCSLAVCFAKNRLSRIDFTNTSLQIGVMQTDSPSLCVTLDSEGPDLEEITSDKYKSKVGYGDMSLYVPESVSAEYGCGRVFSSSDEDEDQPGSVTFKGRGHSSWMYLDKKNFTIKLEKSVSLLGMSKSKSWALVSNHFDRSLIRNMIVNGIADRLGYYTEYRCVELFVDGDYCGSYQLTGKIKIDPKRINVADLEKKNEKLAGADYPPKNAVTAELACGATVKYWADLKSPDDVTGGYLLEVDIASRAKKETSYIKTSRDKYYIVTSPEYISKEEALYLAEYLQGFEDAIYSQNGCDPSGKHFTEYADITTLALRYLVDEMCRNPDGGETSTFFYKDSDKHDGKLYSGPLWDYDLAMGNYSGFSSPEGFETKNRFYYPELFKHKAFTDALKDNYSKVKALIEDEMNNKADVYKEYIRKSAEMNFKRWNCMDTDIRVAPAKAAKSFDRACDYIKDFLKSRLRWLDSNLYKDLK